MRLSAIYSVRRHCRRAGAALLAAATVLAVAHPSAVSSAAAAAGVEGTGVSFVRERAFVASAPVEQVIDVTGDRDPDLVAFSGSGVQVAVGRAGTAFGAWTSVAMGARPAGLTVVDFNGDGDPDLLAPQRGSASVVVRYGAAGATFGAAGSIAMPYPVWEVAVLDADGDGRRDLAITSVNENRVTILTASATGFTAGATFETFNQATRLRVGDLNGDGDPDLVYLMQSGLGGLLGGEGATFRAAPEQTRFNEAYRVELADFNGDNLPDAAMSGGEEGGHVDVLLGDGDGTFGDKGDTTLNGDGRSGSRAPQVGDLNGDGHLDVLFTIGDDLMFRLGDGAGGWAPTVRTGNRAGQPRVGDLDGDGRADLVLSTSSGVVVYRSGPGVPRQAPTMLLTKASCHTDRVAQLGLNVTDPDSPYSDLVLTEQNTNSALLQPSDMHWRRAESDHWILVRLTPTGQGAGNLKLTASDDGRTATLTVHVQAGGPSTDRLTGTDDPDLLFGGAGGDTIDARGGIDAICAGDGDDVIAAGQGADYVTGEVGNDRVNGGPGDDHLQTATGDDVVDAGPGNDTVHTGTGSDRITGGPGNDQLSSAEGDDRLTGGTGADAFKPGPGRDTVTDLHPGEGDTLDGTLP
ncbi:hypothetical protein GCM10010124_40130 [Pilimelia terevasa]|uniref:Uncharacterized protein n=1 Tax=Pilimelia terevasa TaxID=53372 RepID=A0A8J3BQL8_9ACTN|nr:FG-GAP-like repeat-containing protein [Pilimelia terevasa]GGK43353.1 hypothetical protein GCM10010124_40130 [Pilimelia terevasa]